MIKLTFLGTGTSQGVPMIGCECHVCSSEDSKDKRLRSSIMIETSGVRLVVDAGPDFRQQMLREGVRELDAILLTHSHKDHIAGLDDVRAFNYITKKAVRICGLSATLTRVRTEFDYAFADFLYPGVPQMDLMEIQPDKKFEIEGVEVIPILGLHYMMPVVGYRIGQFAYLTDFNYISEIEFEKLRGLDVLVVNALRRKEHISHFTLLQAQELAIRAGVGRVYFTHISHEIGRYSEVEKELDEGQYFAYDGLVVNTF